MQNNVNDLPLDRHAITLNSFGYRPCCRFFQQCFAGLVSVGAVIRINAFAQRHVEIDELENGNMNSMLCCFGRRDHSQL